MTPHFITIEGPIGIGKTSLATAISNKYNYIFVREIVEENPFLGRFYENIEEWSFQTEMFFLCNRYKQLQDIQHKYLANGSAVVSDYNILKNKIFAQRTLKPMDAAKYYKIYDILTADTPSSSLIVYINASVDTLMSRIERRGRTIERNIDRSYIETLRKDYERFFEHFQELHPDVPVLHLDGDQLDFVEREKDLQYVIDKLAEVLTQ